MNEAKITDAYQRLAVLRRILSIGLSPRELGFINQMEADAIIHMKPYDDTTCRYHADDSAWRLDRMDGGREPPLRGAPGEEPEWLKTILDVARVGGHIDVWPGSDGEPTRTVWFRVNHDNHLTEFIELPK